jgi:hypothetical protein
VRYHNAAMSRCSPDGSSVLLHATIRAPAPASDIQEVMTMRWKSSTKVGASIISVLLLAACGTSQTPTPTPVPAGTPLSCTLSLKVVGPGTTVINGNEFSTEGELTRGTLDCDIDSFDGQFGTSHMSLSTVDANGVLTGRLEGTFAMNTNAGPTLTGKVTADIAGAPTGIAPSPPFPPNTPIYAVTDTGEWQVTSGILSANGTFRVDLAGVVGAPAAQGGLATKSLGVMEGIVTGSN